MDSPQPERAATWAKAVTYTILIIFGFLLVGYLLLLWMAGRFLPQMSDAQAQKLIRQAGGIDTITREADGIFRTYGTNGVYSLSIFDSVITNFPAMRVLLSNSVPKSLLLLPQLSGEPSQITILYGPHFHSSWIRIFEWTNESTVQYASSGTQISTNIFFTH